MTWRLIHADCVEAMAAMDESSVDAVVTDPPYGLEFMGKEWDKAPAMSGQLDRFRLGETGAKSEGYRGLNRHAMQEWHHAWALAALRALKPGGHLLAFGGTRTFHRLTCALEDAGFEIRDCVAWLYGSGFPKSLDVSKAIDKASGAEGSWRREDHPGRPGSRPGTMFGQAGPSVDNPEALRHIYEPETPDAERWQGWGTALKPAFEPIVLARKPLSERNVAANVLRWGTGALNIDGTRIEGEPRTTHADGNHQGTAPQPMSWGESTAHQAMGASGRWPANVTLDPEAAAMLDEQTGERAAGHHPARRGSAGMWSGDGGGLNGNRGSDELTESGGASRFFYCPKADRAEREHGVEHMTRKALLWSSGDQSPGTFQAEGTLREAANNHPTVKPVALMQWLCRMVTQPGGVILDPFTGSGSTGIAAAREGFDFVGIERDEGYVEIARARIQGDAPMFNIPAEDPA